MDLLKGVKDELSFKSGMFIKEVLARHQWLTLNKNFYILQLPRLSLSGPLSCPRSFCLSLPPPPTLRALLCYFSISINSPTLLPLIVHKVHSSDL
jgi:hypothetical protein